MSQGSDRSGAVFRIRASPKPPAHRAFSSVSGFLSEQHPRYLTAGILVRRLQQAFVVPRNPGVERSKCDAGYGLRNPEGPLLIYPPIRPQCIRKAP